MKMNKKVLGLALGGIMSISLVGCSENKMEKAEDKIEMEVQDFVERNIEEYSTYYNLNDYQQTDLDVAKKLDMNKVEVNIEELDDKYEVTLNLGYKDDTDCNGNTDKYVIYVDKDVDLSNFNMEDMYHKKDFEVVACESIIITDNGTHASLRCKKGYNGLTHNYYNDSKYGIINITDINLLKDFLYSNLGDITVDENN